jgi:hypothetical protein
MQSSILFKYNWYIFGGHRTVAKNSSFKVIHAMCNLSLICECGWQIKIFFLWKKKKTFGWESWHESQKRENERLGWQIGQSWIALLGNT